MDASSPPHYRRLSRQGQVPSVAELPPYTRRNTLAQPASPPREPTEHAISIFQDGQKARPWATLKVYSSAKSNKSLPTFFEKENINGSVEIFAEKGDSIHGITVSVTGRVITGSGSRDEFTFLNIVRPLWTKCSDSSRPPAEGASGPKLLGPCSWSFSMVLPRKVELPNGSGGVSECNLPETFLERQTMVSIQYDLIVTICRGRLRSDNQIKTAFGYIPSTRPDQFSHLRQLAYLQGTTLPGPDADPEGWEVYPSVPISGRMFKSQPVRAQCTLALPKPLCYTRGGPLPCAMTIECADSQTLDILSTPTSILVTLQRRVRFFRSPTSVKMENPWTESIEDVGTAIWHASGSRASSIRTLEGEIRLAKDLRPTSSIGTFSVAYAIVLHQFDAPCYSPSDASPLLVCPVQIATMFGRGPRPIAYSPPAYEPCHVSSRAANNDYHATLCGQGMNLRL